MLKSLNLDSIFAICFWTCFLNKLCSHQKSLTLSRSIFFVRKQKKAEIMFADAPFRLFFFLFPLFSFSPFFSNILFSTTSFLLFLKKRLLGYIYFFFRKRKEITSRKIEIQATHRFLPKRCISRPTTYTS